MSDPRTILEEGARSGLHLGAQLFVSKEGETIFDFACGEARAGIPMRADSLMPWLSSGKPLTAAAIAQLSERRILDLHSPVSRYLPEFGKNGKETITLAHLLTHTAGFRGADKIPEDTPWDEMIQRICQTPLEANWAPGARAGYSTAASWFILGEIIQRLTVRPFGEYMKSEWLDPLGMTDSWLRLPFEQYKKYGGRLALLHDTAAVKRDPMFPQDAAGMAQCRPGSSARGPVRELARFYEMLLNRGTFNDRQFLSPDTIDLFTTRHRSGLYDETFLHTLDFGYGFIINSNRYGAETVPYGYGRHSSENTFGHSGAQSSCAFADPAHKLVVAWAANGLPGERLHQKRQREINNAVFDYLKINRTS